MSEEPRSGESPLASQRHEMEIAERAAISTARATWAIAALTLATMVVGIFQYVTFGRQLSVMQGQLDAMMRDEQPRLRLLTEIMPGPGFGLLSGSLDTGNVYWNVPYFNAGKENALEVTVETYMSLDGRPYVRSDREKRPDPLQIDEMLPGANAFLTIFSSPIPKAQFDVLKSKENGISIYLNFSFRDDFGHHSHLSGCFLLLPNGLIANLNAAECKKKIAG
jgi:hypothetical protein